MLTKKCEYGPKPIVHLSVMSSEKAAQVGDIAQAAAISKKFLDHIMTPLRNAGFVYSKRGKLGRYALARPANQIRVGDIVRVLNGPLAPIQCASVTAFLPCADCENIKTCPVSRIMFGARDAIACVLDRGHVGFVERFRTSGSPRQLWARKSAGYAERLAAQSWT